MKKFAFISDLIFTFFVVAIFSLCLFRYLDVTLWYAVALACLCGTLATLAVGAILSIRRKNAFLKKSDELKKQKLLTHLALSSDEANTEFFRKFLQDSKNETATKVKRFARLRLYTETEFYFLHFSFTPVTADEIAAFSRLKTGKKQKILLCSQIHEDAKALCERLHIDLRTGNELFLALKKADALPEKFLGEETVNKKAGRKFKLWFAKSNSRRFLTSGTLILLLSWLTPFSYYYLIMGSLLLLIAVFTRIFGYETKKI